MTKSVQYQCVMSGCAFVPLRCPEHLKLNMVLSSMDTAVFLAEKLGPFSKYSNHSAHYELTKGSFDFNGVVTGHCSSYRISSKDLLTHPSFIETESSSCPLQYHPLHFLPNSLNGFLSSLVIIFILDFAPFAY